MPIYEYRCPDCECVESILVSNSDKAPLAKKCPQCEGEAIKLFPLPAILVFNEHYEPAFHTKFNWNPQRAMSEVPGGGADYARRYTEHRKGFSQYDINGDPNLPNIPTELKGTVEDQRKRGLFKDVHKHKQGQRLHQDPTSA
jgi:putative FmdB family regulatory protein